MVSRRCLLLIGTDKITTNIEITNIEITNIEITNIEISNIDIGFQNKEPNWFKG